jgi:hypothetical protein
MMWIIDDEIPPPPYDPPEPEQQWICGPFGCWPLTFPWADGVSWGMWRLS